jgi:hypothetical protein
MMAPKPARRSAAEVLKLVEKANALIAGGKSIEAALTEVDLAESVYRRHSAKKNGELRGTMDAASFPARPKKKLKRAPKPINMSDVASVANRISRIDVKLGTFKSLTEERKTLASRLMALLKH